MGCIDETKALFWLSLSGATAKRLNLVLKDFSAVELWEGANPQLSFALGQHYDTLMSYRKMDIIEFGMEKIRDMGINILTINNPDYPLYLNQPEVSPPLVLYYRGSLKVLKKPCIAIVGTRSSSPYGTEIAEMFAKEFALSGVTVVSGMASGIDECAHKAALASGTTAAVLGGGFNTISPYSKDLFNKIAANGVVLSEYPPKVAPTKFTFPERNRIISGLSQAVVVVEAAKKSGALITADYAIEQSREVYAVPGSILSAKSSGCNSLIKEGSALAALSPHDILSDLKLNFAQDNKKQTHISLDFFEEKIYNLLSGGQMHFNDLLDSVNQPKELMKTLTNLELKGLIKRLPGNFYRLSIN